MLAVQYLIMVRPAVRFSGRRRFLRLAAHLACAGLILSVAGLPRPAHADPHAIFYTAIGQQQLFFNMLAALNQADYVETDQEREVLVTKRAQPTAGPGQQAEDNPIVTSTATDLSSVLSRLVTLEGNDLWTAFQAHQLALESKRRNDSERLFWVLCNQAYGYKDCLPDGASGPSRELPQKPGSVRVKNIEDWLGLSFEKGVAAVLQSGSAADQAKREELDRKKLAEEPFGRKDPYLYDTNISAARKLAAAGPEAEAIEGVFEAVEGAFVTTPVSAGAFSGLSFDAQTGAVGYAVVVNQQPQSTSEANALIDAFTGKLSAMVALPGAALDTGLRALGTYQGYQELVEEQGALGYTEYLPQGGPQGAVGGLNTGAALAQGTTGLQPDKYKTLGVLQTAPVHGNIAAAASGANLAGLLDATQTHAIPNAIKTRDTDELVGHRQNQTSPSGVQGLTSDPAGTVQGIVAAEGDTEHSGHLQQEIEVFTKLFAPDANTISPSDENGPVRFLNILKGKEPEDFCGCDAAAALSAT